jgi:hypothetical protein
MSKIELSESTRSQIKKWSASAAGPDEDARAELEAHADDKVIAYVSSQERITEADAWLLARERMGDPNVLRRELTEARPSNAQTGASLARRLAAIAAATLLAMIASQTLSLIIRNGLFVTDQSLAGATRAFWVSVVAEAVLMILAHATLVPVLRQWRRREDAGESLWFDTFSPERFTLLLAALLTLYAVVPFISTRPLLMPAVLVPQDPQFAWLVLLFVLSLIPWAVQGLLWFWWADRGGRRVLQLTWAVGTWAAFLFLASLVQAKETWYVNPNSGGVTLSVGWNWPTPTTWHALDRPIFAGGVALAVYIVSRGVFTRQAPGMTPVSV